MTGPDGWRVPAYSIALTPNERDEIRAWATRLGKPVATAIRELALAEARRSAKASISGLRCRGWELVDGQWLEIVTTGTDEARR